MLILAIAHVSGPNTATDVVDQLTTTRATHDQGGDDKRATISGFISGRMNPLAVTVMSLGGVHGHDALHDRVKSN